MKCCCYALAMFLFLGGQLVRAATNDTPHSIAELNAGLKDLPANQNAATFYRKAFAALSLTNVDYKTSPLPWFRNSNLPVPGKPFTPEVSSALEDVLRRNTAVFEFCEKAARLERCCYVTNCAAITPLPHLRDIRLVSRLQALRGLSFAGSGDRTAARENLLGTLHLIRSLEPEPIMVSQMVRSGCLYYALKELEEIVNRVSMPEQSWQELEQAFDRMEKDDADGVHYRRALTGDRVMWNEFFNMPLADQTTIFWNDEVHRTRAEMEALLEKNSRSDDLQFINRGCDEIQTRWLQPYPARLTVSDIYSARAQEATNQNYVLSGYAFNSGNTVRTEARGLATLRLAQTALALERYRTAHHETYPELLSDLVPEYLPKPALDPFNGKSLQYRRVGKGYVLQSVGPSTDQGESWIKKQLVFAVITPPPSVK